MKLLVVSLKENSGFQSRVLQMLQGSGRAMEIKMADETSPSSLEARARLVLESDVILALTSLKFQRDVRVVEMCSLGYERYKVMAMYMVEQGYRPFGPLVLVISILGHISDTNDECLVTHIDSTTPAQLMEALTAKVKSVVRLGLGGLETMLATPRPQGSLVVIHCASDAQVLVDNLKKRLVQKNVSVKLLPVSQSGSDIKELCVYIPVITERFLNTSNSETAFEKLRQLDPHMRPVSPQPDPVNQHAPSWAQLAFSGKKIHTSEDLPALTEEVKKLAKVSDKKDRLEIQATEDDFAGATPFML